MTKTNKNFPIADYLKDKHKKKPGNYYYGICKACEKVVAWKKAKVIVHKLSKNKICVNISDAKQAQFRQFVDNFSDSLRATTDNLTQTLLTKTIDKLPLKEKKGIDEAILAFFLETSLPLTVADKKEFKDMIAVLRPAYAPHIPSSKILFKWIEELALEASTEED